MFQRFRFVVTANGKPTTVVMFLKSIWELFRGISAAKSRGSFWELFRPTAGAFIGPSFDWATMLGWLEVMLNRWGLVNISHNLGFVSEKGANQMSVK